MTKFNGWTNYETWNVALWVQNDENLYKIAQNIKNFPNPYWSFVESLKGYYGIISDACRHTPDGVAWNSKDLNFDELNKMMLDL